MITVKYEDLKELTILGKNFEIILSHTYFLFQLTRFQHSDLNIHGTMTNSTMKIQHNLSTVTTKITSSARREKMMVPRLLHLLIGSQNVRI